MTPLNKSIRRLSSDTLDGAYGKDKYKKIVITLIPGGSSPDRIELRPAGTRRPESATVADMYSYMLRCRANRSKMEKLREKLEKKRLKEQERKSRRIILGGLPHENR